MILSLVQKYIEDKMEVLNGQYGTSIILKQIETELDLDKIGASESFIHYQLYVTSMNRPEVESNFKEFTFKIEFYFLVANKNNAVYKQKFDRYIFGLERLLYPEVEPMLVYSDMSISNSLYLNDIKNVQITNADRFTDDGAYYNPSIEFTFLVSDNVTSQNNVYVSESV